MFPIYTFIITGLKPSKIPHIFSFSLLKKRRNFTDSICCFLVSFSLCHYIFLSLSLFPSCQTRCNNKPSNQRAILSGNNITLIPLYVILYLTFLVNAIFLSKTFFQIAFFPNCCVCVCGYLCVNASSIIQARLLHWPLDPHQPLCLSIRTLCLSPRHTACLSDGWKASVKLNCFHLHLTSR